MISLRHRHFSTALRVPRACTASRVQCGSRALSAASVRAVSSTNDVHPMAHVPVLLQETLAALCPETIDAVGPLHFVDGTAGCGGHARAILQTFPEAKVLCVDRDPEVLTTAQANLVDFHCRVSFCTGSYADLTTHLKRATFPREVDGILVDLGANSFHFDAARRGFSVMKDGPLDMRFDQSDSERPTAADAVNTLSEVQLTKIFRSYGEEKLAKEFAKAIVREREERGTVFETTRELRECIERIANMWKSPKVKKGSHKQTGKRASRIGSTHPATRCFQALRIHVNDELHHVERGVKLLANHLAPHRRLVTIAFHSLEDRPIKRFFRELDEQGRVDAAENEDDVNEWDDRCSHEADDGNRDDDINMLCNKRFRLTRRKATKATAEEIAINSRSRGARMRCLERIR
ncbi:unnamed protein product [Hyaloperonospora brassicae]|uniref:S-adenosyl-methyltransferase MraW n=1 Tax=Hyaloperonospora brassicae TaxID=162125 RepID=A0AAV0T941_HYABA|nr:unnamed protein product [Hyaloperonospora brassicae]